jgi:hypothetical protein
MSARYVGTWVSCASGAARGLPCRKSAAAQFPPQAHSNWSPGLMRFAALEICTLCEIILDDELHRRLDHAAQMGSITRFKQWHHVSIVGVKSLLSFAA